MNQYARYLPLKSAIEDLFGAEAWYALKESNHLPTWKKQLSKTIDALSVSIQSSIEIYDEDWIKEIIQAVDSGKKYIKSSTDIEEAISSACATFINISFLQVGLMPRRTGRDIKVSLKRENWQLNQFRTVMYTQNKDQKESIFWSKQQKEIGAQNQMDLWSKFRGSKNSLPYSEWCRENA